MHEDMAATRDDGRPVPQQPIAIRAGSAVAPFAFSAPKQYTCQRYRNFAASFNQRRVRLPMWHRGSQGRQCTRADTFHWAAEPVAGCKQRRRRAKGGNEQSLAPFMLLFGLTLC